MLQSDVGTGKTAVYGMLAITATMNYKQVVILMPNTLVRSIYYSNTKNNSIFLGDKCFLPLSIFIFSNEMPHSSSK